MHYNKYPHPSNFEYLGKLLPQKTFKTALGTYRLDVAASSQDIYHLTVTGKDWEKNESQAGIKFSKIKGLKSASTQLVFPQSGGMRLETLKGETLLESFPKKIFGQLGKASIFQFYRQKDANFYGFGEKWTGFEHSDKTTKFWNTDVCGDFARDTFINGKPDPIYVSIPYMIIKRANTYVGILLDNPHSTFMATMLPRDWFNCQVPKDDAILVGAEEGQPNLYLIVGPSLPELTRKLQKLIGTTPLPPAWSLGYNQCRWGYKSDADLKGLRSKFAKNKIPVDGLWLDIDYMDGFRVFTFNKDHFKNPAKTFAELKKSGHKVVPIIDPGVKIDPKYDVYKRGKAAKAFCQTHQKTDYVGMVWPGETVFPDFSLPSARAWWAKEVKRFADHGIYGAWLDMNDPSTGQSEFYDMLFANGKKEHTTFHNQYALGMAIASREGFLASHPEERPFLVCRSGYIGSNRYTAIWTGDNQSNYHHLRTGISCTLNLALSGIPFNGPDAGGFGLDATPELIRDWFKAGFLFPFFRQHSCFDTKGHEPWAFGAETQKVLSRYIQMRYRLRPYLYQLFVGQELSGEAIMRPLFYDFEDTAKLPLNKIDDQFMVGPLIMQAPFITEKQKTREVVLPGNTRWYSPSEDRWLEGGQKITVKADLHNTPLYVREGSIIPMARLTPEDHTFNSKKIDFHIFHAKSSLTQNKTFFTSEIPYAFDDGSTFEYQKGKRSVANIRATTFRDKVEITVTMVKDGYGKGDFTFTTLPEIRHVIINGRPAKKIAAQGIPFGKAKTQTWQ